MKNPLTLLKKSETVNQIITSPVYVKYNLIIAPAVILVMSLLIIFLVTVPQFYNLLEIYKTIEQLKQKQSFYDSKASSLEKIPEDNYQNYLETALIALPADKDIPGSISQIVSIVGSSGLKLNNISLGNPAVSEGQLNDFTVRLEVGGDFDQVKGFLENSKQIARLNKLQSISITGSPGKTALLAEIVLQVFYQTLPKNIGSIDEPLPQITDVDLKLLDDIKSKVGVIKEESVAPEGAKGKFDPFN